ncbi:hypothetical protein NL676_036040 [Syzygium grande]|nr:hypothetical protein NL676_036040 [Syzygium grande]
MDRQPIALGMDASMRRPMQLGTWLRDIREVLTAAIDTMDRIKIHIMGWPNQTRPNTSPAMGAAALRPIVHLLRC